MAFFVTEWTFRAILAAHDLFLVNEWTFRAIVTAHDFCLVNELTCRAILTAHDFFLFWTMNELFVQPWLRMTFFGQWMNFSCNLDCTWLFLLINESQGISENLRDHYALVDTVSFYLHIMLWLMLSPSTSTYEQFSQRISEIIMFWFMLPPSTSILCSGWCCLLLPPHMKHFLRESQRSLCSGWCCLLLPPHYALADAVSFYLHIRIFSPRESHRSLYSGWCCLLLPPHYALVNAVSFYLRIWTIFSENLRDHYALADVVSFYLRILFWLMLSPSISTYDQFFPDNIRDHYILLHVVSFLFTVYLFNRKMFPW